MTMAITAKTAMPTAMRRHATSQLVALTKASNTRGAYEKPKATAIPMNAFAIPRRASNHSITMFRDASVSTPWPVNRSMKKPSAITANATIAGGTKPRTPPTASAMSTENER